jgi:hypothetical protein
MKTHFRKCSGIPSVTSTVTSGAFHRAVSGGGSFPGPSSSAGSASSLSRINTLPSPPAPRPHITTEEDLHQLQLHQQQQQLQQQIQQQLQHQQQRLIAQHEISQLSPTRQQQILRELGHNSGTAPGMFSLSSSSTSQSSQTNLSSTSHSLLSPISRNTLRLPSPLSSRRSGGMSLISMNAPAPTSLAAGHPLIPLAAVENIGGSTLLLQGQGSLQPNPAMLMLSPRQYQTNIDVNSASATLSQLQSLSPSQQRRILTSSQIRHAQQQAEQHFHSLQQQLQQQQNQQHGHSFGESSGMHESRVHQLLSPPQQRPPSQSRGSPQRYTSPRQILSSSIEPNELFLPAFTVRSSLSSVHQSQQLPFGQFAQSRSHSHSQQRMSGGSSMNGTSSSHQHHHQQQQIQSPQLVQASLLAVGRTSAPSSSATSSMMPSTEDFLDSSSPPPPQQPPQYLDQEDSLRTPTWRHRDEDDGRYDHDQYKPSDQ